ncbi:MAG: citrate synthase [Acidobacteria bacterium]|nr:citrate synthase [Acidobacteriota bacterium]MBI3473167.1 citrate synthase [Candidatus Solibacter usitatus]
MSTTGAGLEGVVAGESEICYIDGYAGVLSYRGYNIHTLAEHATFEEVIYLLWNGRLPKPAELDLLKTELAAQRGLPQPVADFLGSVPQAAPMDVLRTAVSMLSLHDPLARDSSPEANRLKARKLMAQTATIVSTFDRLRNGRPVLEGDPGLGFAANFLYTLTGKPPDLVMERAFDVALTLHADHELNASTFAARVTAATLSDIYSTITSAIGALKGPLHGGANEDVIRMLLEVGDPDGAVERVREMLARKAKIPGFGHRVYRTEDPRATHLRVLSQDLGKRTGHAALFLMSNRVEQTIQAEKKLNANVDFYSASTYYSLGIPIDLFTPVFAISRMSGWTAHVLEQYHNNRLIRPRAEYKGNPDGMPWVAMGDR